MMDAQGLSPTPTAATASTRRCSPNRFLAAGTQHMRPPANPRCPVTSGRSSCFLTCGGSDLKSRRNSEPFADCPAKPPYLRDTAASVAALSLGSIAAICMLCSPNDELFARLRRRGQWTAQSAGQLPPVGAWCLRPTAPATHWYPAQRQQRVGGCFSSSIESMEVRRSLRAGFASYASIFTPSNEGVGRPDAAWVQSHFPCLIRTPSCGADSL